MLVNAASISASVGWGFSASNRGALDRQAAQGHAGCRVDRVAQGGRTSGGACLADSARMLTALDHVDVDRRRLVDAQRPVIVEVRLLYAALLDRNLAPKRRGQAEDQPA